MEPKDQHGANKDDQLALRVTSSMPWTIVVVLLLYVIDFIILLVSLVMQSRSGLEQIGNLLRLVIDALVVVGIYRGIAIAWQWGALVSVCRVFFSLAFLRYMGGPYLPGFVYLELIPFLLPSLGIALFLLLRPSLIFFGLTCPACARACLRPRDFLFHRCVCSSCGETWDTRDQRTKADF